MHRSRAVLEQRVADDGLGRVLVPYVILNVELFLAQLAAIGALEARRFAAIVLEVGRHRALGRVTLSTTWTGKSAFTLSRASLRVLVLDPR